MELNWKIGLDWILLYCFLIRVNIQLNYNPQSYTLRLKFNKSNIFHPKS